MGTLTLAETLEATTDRVVSEALQRSSPELHKMICGMAAKGDKVAYIVNRCAELGATGEVLRYCQHTAKYQIRVATAN